MKLIKKGKAQRFNIKNEKGNKTLTIIKITTKQYSENFITVNLKTEYIDRFLEKYVCLQI